MFQRVVRFTDVSKERMESMCARIEESGGPPEGVESTGVSVLFDEAQATAVVVQSYETEQAMIDSARIFDAMEPGETPGTRVSVDHAERVLDVHLQDA